MTSYRALPESAKESFGDRPLPRCNTRTPGVARHSYRCRDPYKIGEEPSTYPSSGMWFLFDPPQEVGFHVCPTVGAYWLLAI